MKTNERLNIAFRSGTHYIKDPRKTPSKKFIMIIGHNTQYAVKGGGYGLFNSNNFGLTLYPSSTAS